jgi:hypothetical protein
VDHYQDLRKKISAKGLNAVTQNGVYKGESTLSMLLYHQIGVKLLHKYPNLRAKITESSLNSIEGHIENAGATPLLYMMKTNLGYRMLKECPDIIEKINEDGLNSICRGGEQKGKSLLTYLCSPDGIQILLDNPSLVKKINSESLNQVDSVGPFLFMMLMKTEKGRELLIKHPEVMKKINEASMFSLVQPEADKASSTKKCAADFVDVRSKLFHLFSKEMQSKIIDYKARGNRHVFSIFDAVSTPKSSANDTPAQTIQKKNSAF